ncbi:MAG: hypothetical protein BGO01_20805 [Armatimonadetes bacterium 55-13]|nr:hypothetical protein [Armatimonadota bacterium]OJU64552.1 MAG: hypothetical protein BGO01_20805 [Armatimonadetes bacterium 55-13]
MKEPTASQIVDVRDFFAGGDVMPVKDLFRTSSDEERRQMVADIQEEALINWDVKLNPHAVQAVLSEA